MADVQQKAKSFRDMIPDLMASYVPAAGMGQGAAAMLTPELMHEQLHQNMMQGAQQQADEENDAALAQGASPQSMAPIAGINPSDPLASAAMATQVAQGAMAGGGGVPLDNSELRDFLQNQVQQSTQAEADAQNQLKRSYDLQSQGAQAEMQGKEKELAAGVAEQAANQPLLAEKTEAQKQFELQQQAINQAGQRAYEAQMTRVRAAMSEASQAEMKSFWGDASTGAKILGVIAQALSGAANGLAGNPSAVTPLDRLIEQDMQRQEYNANQKNKAAYREQGMLGTIQKQTGDRLAAALATKVAAWDRVDRMIAENHNAIGGATAQAQSDQLHALAAQRKGMYQEKLSQLLLSNAQTDKQEALRSLGTMDATAAASAGRSLAAKANHMSVFGFKDDGSINHAQYTQIAPLAKNYSGYVDALATMKRIAHEGLSSNPVRQKALYDAAYARAFGIQRADQGAGANLQGPEAKNIEAMIPSFFQAITPGYRSARGGLQIYDDLIDQATDSYVNKAQALGVHSELAPDDSIGGQAIARYIQRHAQRGK